MSISKPTVLPIWATDPTADVVEPSLGKKGTGWVTAEKPPAQFFNWWMENIFDWTHYLGERTDVGASALSGNQELYVLSDGETLLVAVDGAGAQTATFNTADFADITNATAAEVIAVINTDVTGATAADEAGFVRITSDTSGVNASIQVTGGTANTALGYDTSVIFKQATLSLIGRVTAGGADDIRLSDTGPGLQLIDSNDTTSFRLGVTAGRFQISIDTDGDLVQDSTGHYNDNSNAFVFNNSGDLGLGAVPIVDLHMTRSTSLEARFQCGTNDATGVLFRFVEQATTFQGGFIRYDAVADDFILGVHDAADANPANDIDAITIERITGNVGMGVVPLGRLHVFLGETGNARFMRTTNQGILITSDVTGNVITGLSSESNKKSLVLNSTHGSQGSPAGSLGYRFRVQDVDALVIAENLNIGIGTDPIVDLHMTRSTSLEARFQCGTADTTGIFFRFVGQATNFEGGFIRYDAFETDFIIGVHNTPDTDTAFDLNAIVIKRASADVALIGNLSLVGPTRPTISILMPAAVSSFIRLEESGQFGGFLKYDATNDNLVLGTRISGSDTNKLELRRDSDIFRPAADNLLDLGDSTKRFRRMEAFRGTFRENFQAPTTQTELVSRHAQNAVVARGRITGSGGAKAVTGEHWNVNDVTDTGAGSYRINLDEDMDENCTVVATLDAASGFVARASVDTGGASITVNTVDFANISVDRDFTFVAIGSPETLPT